MRYVTVEWEHGGTTTDPRAYLAWLADHADELPPGARAFALDPAHYDFSDQWSPRSASFDRMSTRLVAGRSDVTLVLAAFGGAPPEFVLRYQGVTHLEVDLESGDGPRPGLLVDEILPHEVGVSHELEFTSGTVTIVAVDLTAGWSGAGVPDRPRDPVDSWDTDNPATHTHLMRTRPGMYFMDDRFGTVSATVRWSQFLWADREAHGRFQDWAGARLIGGPGPVIWEGLVLRTVAPGVERTNLTDEHHRAAVELTFDLLDEYFAEQGFVAS